MKDLKWLINRLKAMSFGEVLWRMQQKAQQQIERTLYMDQLFLVTELKLRSKIACLFPDISRIGLNWGNTTFSLNKEISLFDHFSYEKYKNEWNAGFQTENHWPLTFSHDLNCQQRIDIGDVRTNWELNRHFQFAVLAKNYYVSGKLEFLYEFVNLFKDWVAKNPFMHGVSWTSTMEVAIRVNSWVYSYCFLKQATAKHAEIQNEELLNEIRLGISGMTDYVTKHYSRFSSANNHLIIEAYAIGLSGILFGYKKWIDLSVRILTEELPRQNFTDGVNKEMSLHYQTFIMEAYGLFMHIMQHNHIEVPDSWYFMLDKMSQFVSDCMGEHGEVIIFGDNDEGKILDLCGKEINYYQYVLDLMGCVLKSRYSDFGKCHENINWLYTENELKEFRQKPLYKNRHSICYEEGGYSILRSKDKRVLIGIDHAPLGYGSIAAHGHADALSFQMFVDGVPVFVDPGTYNYHLTPEDRDYFRSTENHNTVTVEDKNQSEILGPFLWGKKANCRLISSELEERDVIDAEHDGYGSTRHRRVFIFNNNQLRIKDKIISNKVLNIKVKFLLGPNIEITKVDKYMFLLSNGKSEIQVSIISRDRVKLDLGNAMYSKKYNKFVGIKVLVLNAIDVQNVEVETIIDIF